MERIRVPRTIYDGIAKDAEGSAEVRKSLNSGPCIDMQKLYLRQGRPVPVS